MVSPTVPTDKKFLCPTCGEVALTVSAAGAALVYRAISNLLCPNGHGIRITSDGEVLVTPHLRVNKNIIPEAGVK